MAPIEKVLQMAGNPSQPPRRQGYHTFTIDICQARARWTSVSHWDPHQEVVHVIVPSFHQADIHSCGGQKTQSQKVGQARLSPGTTTHDLLKTRPSSDTSPPHPRLFPLRHRRRLPRRNIPPTSHQKPGLDKIILSPQSRIVLQGRRRH